MIDKNTIIVEVLRQKPEAQRVFQQHGLPCVGWGAALYESIGQAAQGHGIDVEKLLADLKALGM